MPWLQNLRSVWSLLPQRAEEFLQQPWTVSMALLFPLFYGKKMTFIKSPYTALKWKAFLGSSALQNALHCQTQRALPAGYSGTHEQFNSKIHPAVCASWESTSTSAWACIPALKPTLKVRGGPDAKLPCLHMYFPLFLQLFPCCIPLVIMTSRDIMFLLKSYRIRAL